MIDVYEPDVLRAELEAALALGDLALDGITCDAFALPDDLSVDDFTLDSQLQTRIHRPPKSRMLHPRLVRYENAQRMAEDIGDLAEPGARCHAVLGGNFIFGDFIEAWIVRHNWLIPDLHIATLSLSRDNLDSLANLLHGGYVERIHLMVSDWFYAKNRGQHGLIAYAYQELDLGGDRFQLSITGSHCKIVLIQTAAGAHYLLHGSANLCSSVSIEQLAIEHDPDLYAFHRDWLDALERQYRTIHPEQPGPAAPKRHQWQQVQDSVVATTPAVAPPSTAPPKAPKALPRNGATSSNAANRDPPEH